MLYKVKKRSAVVILTICFILIYGNNNWQVINRSTYKIQIKSNSKIRLVNNLYSIGYCNENKKELDLGNYSLVKLENESELHESSIIVNFKSYNYNSLPVDQAFLYVPILIVLIVVFSGCKKSSYLDEKPDQSLIIPQTISDFQKLIDNENYINGLASSTGVLPSFGEIGADDYYVIDEAFPTGLFSPSEQNSYVWNDDIYSPPIFDWTFPYRSIFYCNVVIDGLGKIGRVNNDASSYDRIYGSALFHRAHMFYQLAQVFAPPYFKDDSNEKFGIPLKLKSDINEVVQRASLRETFDRIVSDLKTSIDLLPQSESLKTRPSKAAAYGLLARVYLTIANYDSAYLYANRYLQYKHELMDYNTLVNIPSYTDNPEVVFQSLIIGSNLLTTTFTRIDSNLYNSYSHLDLRKNLFFEEATSGPSGGIYKSSYNGTYNLWGGIATDEIMLIRAECLARRNDIGNALADLNKLIRMRQSNSAPYEEILANTKEEALALVLLERRKELVFRGLRWSDLRRLNYEGYNIVLKRVVAGNVYQLFPNSLNYTYLIPPNVMEYHSNWPQNSR